MGVLSTQDADVYNAIQREVARQKDSIELIPSENIVSEAVLEAQGTILTNKYAEGYPGRRYYGGCQHVDEVEQLAIDRAKKLFGCEYANVQPHSGSQANMGVFFSFIEPGDKILGMRLNDGGHLTHGAGVNFSGFLYDVHDYGVRESDQLIDYDMLRDQAKKIKPKLIIAGASAYPRKIDFETFGSIAKEVGAYLLVDMAHIAGLVAAGEHPSPVPYADFVTSTTHKTLRGPRGGVILAKEEFGKRINFRICPGIQGGPLMHIIAAKAVAFQEAMTEDFREYQRQIVVNAKALAAALLEEGFNLVSGGTENHLVLIDLRNKDLTGKYAEEILDKVGITCNKNTVPFETQKPLITSGIRLGTPVLTTRGMGPEQMQWLAKTITKTLQTTDESALGKIREEVTQVCRQFPIYKNL